MTEDSGVWLSFQLAAEEVERRLGLTWGLAQKTLLELCESDTLRWRQHHSGPDVSSNDLRRWLQDKLTRKTGGKQARIIELLRTMFPDGVPDVEHCPRYTLKAKLLKLNRDLKPLDEATLKSAIDNYNAEHPKRS
jgi:hypothetical protein